ncbi:unnamed protein product [Mycena citricolor]|uniref:Riboflavin synthase n=1 Tax=Mycena citricolor TaxID=2018698 RepID=A0AAD2Q637_9AGAR|nr:unnamed protein product [Mycena citricolor]
MPMISSASQSGNNLAQAVRAQSFDSPPAMFTGLIEHLGTVASIVVDDAGCTLTISDAAPILGDAHIGDSIAVNGACLTVTAFDAGDKGGWFTVWLANETLQRTDLGERKVGEQLNLERAMGAHVRFGGHFVQAHVDTTATVVDQKSDGDSLRLTFQFPEPTAERPSLLRYIIPKGYVTIDGASLTVTGVDDAARKFSVMLIQHTQEKITLSKKPLGSTVNIEVDMVGKYVEKSVVGALGGSGDSGLKAMIEKVVEEVLVKKGVPSFDGLWLWPARKGPLHIHLFEYLLTSKQVTVKVTEASPRRPYAARSPSPFKSNASNIPSNIPPPVFRPKSKVNSTATSTLVRKAASTVSPSTISRSGSVKSSVSTRTAAPSLTPRSGSPTKQLGTVRPKATVTRGLTARAVPTVQDARRHSLTGFDYASRNAPITVSDILNLSDDERTTGSSGPSPRVTAKVSRFAKQQTNVDDSLSSSPHYGSLRAQAPLRPRVPSVSSTASSSSSPFHPPSSIASTPAGRYTASVRSSASASPSGGGSHYQSFPEASSSSHAARYTSPPRTINGSAYNSPIAKVDPAAVPLPTNSPPTSALSYSSRSSVADSNSRLKVHGALEMLMGLSAQDDDDDDDDDDDEDDNDEEDIDSEAEKVRQVEREVRAEAKSVRKIADLEITNKSLLTINASLEQTKHRQAKEIRDLRRKLRESRLVLPPRDFRKLDEPEPELEEEESSDSEEEEEENEADNTKDEGYRRVKAILETLLESGRRALESTPKDFPEPVKITKVLSAYEVEEAADGDDDEADESMQQTVSFRSEDEVEELAMAHSRSPSPFVPPTS